MSKAYKQAVGSRVPHPMKTTRLFSNTRPNAFLYLNINVRRSLTLKIPFFVQQKLLFSNKSCWL